jgi:Zn-finger nucleic acid-binding protein
MWFNSGQLDDVKDGVLPEIGWLEIDDWKEEAELKAQKTSDQCPQCREGILTKIEDEQSTTQVSMCPACNGTWLGPGQFLYLVNALLDEANQKSAPEFIKISLQQAKEVLTKSDATVEDWQNLKTVLTLLKHRIFVQHPKLKSIIMGVQKSLPL